MKLTKKAKLENFDAIKADRDKLQLAAADLAGATPFRFESEVTVDCGEEIDSAYSGEVFVVRVSRRAMPLYMICSRDGEQLRNASFEWEYDIEAKREDCGIYWRALRHAIWKQGRANG